MPLSNGIFSTGILSWLRWYKKFINLSDLDQNNPIYNFDTIFAIISTLKFNFKINPLFIFKNWKKTFPIRDSESWVHFTVIKYHFEPHQVHNYVSPHRQRLGLVPMSLIFIAVWWVCGYVVPQIGSLRDRCFHVIFILWFFCGTHHLTSSIRFTSGITDRLLVQFNNL